MQKCSMYNLVILYLLSSLSTEASNSLRSSTPNMWIQLPNTQLKSIIEPSAYKQPISGFVGPKAIITAWNGAVWNEQEQRMDIIGAGGHADYCGNEYNSFDLDDMRWYKIHGPSKLDGYDFTSGRTPDGRPASRHTYQGQVYVESREKTYIFGGSLCSDAGTADNRRWSVTNDGQYEFLGGTSAWTTLGGHALFDNQSGHILLVKRGHVYQYNIDKNTLIDLTPKEADGRWGTSAALDTNRHRVLALGHGAAWIYDIDKNTKYKIDLHSRSTIKQTIGLGLVYIEKIDRYVAWAGGNSIMYIHPITFSIDIVLSKGVAPTSNPNGIYGRFRYSEKYNGFVVVSRYDEDVYFLPRGEQSIENAVK